MEGPTNNDVVVVNSKKSIFGFLKRLPKFPKLSKKLFKVFLILLLLAGVAFGIYFIYANTKPLYVIGDVEISKKDIREYALALDEYKKTNPKEDFKGKSSDVAKSDLILNAAYKNEFKMIISKDKNIKIPPITKYAIKGSDDVKKMLTIRAENVVMKDFLKDRVIVRKDLLVIGVAFDVPFFDKKNKEETLALHKEAKNILEYTFMPVVRKGLPKDKIAQYADVNLLDKDKTDDNNYQQYFDKLVSSVELREGFRDESSSFNDLPITEYNGVKLDLKNTRDEIRKLKDPGDFTNIFASQTGNYYLIRLEKTNNAKYTNWDEFLKTYTKKYATSEIFAHEFSLSSIAEKTINSAVLAVTTPGLQKAQAASCGSHNIAFVVKSYNSLTGAEIPNGTTIMNSRSAHNCGSQFTGNRVFSSVLFDNCLGPAPVWSIVSMHDQANFHSPWFFSDGKFGWPDWSVNNINGKGTIEIKFYYQPKTGNPGPNNPYGVLDGANCNNLWGWVKDDDAIANGDSPTTVHIYFEQPVGVAGAVGWNIGPAANPSPDVGNHRFDRSMTDPSIPINPFDGNTHTVYAYGINDGAGTNPELSSTPRPHTFGPCTRPPRPPDIFITADCNVFEYQAVDPDGATSSFNYTVHVSNGVAALGMPVVLNSSGSGRKSVVPWAPSPVRLGDVNGVHFRVWATEIGGGGETSSTGWSIAQCPSNNFNISATANTNLIPSSEDPQTADFSATFTSNENIKNIQITCNYYIKPNGVTSPPYTPLTGGTVATRNLNNAAKSTVCAENIPIPSTVDAGDQICADYSASPGGGKVDIASELLIGPANPQTYRLDNICKEVVNKPYISFYGNDVKAGMGIENTNNCVSAYPNASISTYSNSGTGSGSGVQIAAFAMGTINGFDTHKRDLPNGGSNKLSASTIGTLGTCTQDYFHEAPSAVSSAFSLTDNTEKFLFKPAVNTSYDVSAMTIPVTKDKYIYVDGDVTISGDILFASGATTIKDLPSFYLVAKGNIYIQKGVTRLSGVYVAQNVSGNTMDNTKGHIYTCADGRHDYLDTPALAAQVFSDCSKQLVVNGVFVGQKMHFGRTFGSLRDAVNDNPFSGSVNCSNSGNIPPLPKTCASEAFYFNPDIFLASSPKPNATSENKNERYPFSNSLPPIL